MYLFGLRWVLLGTSAQDVIAMGFNRLHRNCTQCTCYASRARMRGLHEISDLNSVLALKTFSSEDWLFFWVHWVHFVCKPPEFVLKIAI